MCSKVIQLHVYICMHFYILPFILNLLLIQCNYFVGEVATHFGL